MTEESWQGSAQSSQSSVSVTSSRSTKTWRIKVLSHPKKAHRTRSDGLTGIKTDDSIDESKKKEGTLLGLHVACLQWMAKTIAPMAQNRTCSFTRDRAEMPARVSHGGTMVLVMMMMMLCSQGNHLWERLAVHEPMICRKRISGVYISFGWISQ